MKGFATLDTAIVPSSTEIRAMFSRSYLLQSFTKFAITTWTWNNIICKGNVKYRLLETHCKFYNMHLMPSLWNQSCSVECNSWDFCWDLLNMANLFIDYSRLDLLNRVLVNIIHFLNHQSIDDQQCAVYIEISTFSSSSEVLTLTSFK